MKLAENFSDTAKAEDLIREADEKIAPLLRSIISASPKDPADFLELLLSYGRLKKTLEDFAAGKKEGTMYNFPALFAHDPRITEINPLALFQHHVGNILTSFPLILLRINLDEESRDILQNWADKIKDLAYPSQA